MLVNLNDKKVTTIKHQQFLDQGKLMLGNDTLSKVKDYIDNQIHHNTVHTAGWMQKESDWKKQQGLIDMNKAFEDRYPDDLDKAKEECGKLFGLIVFERFMIDSNIWCFVKTEEFGMRYFMKQKNDNDVQ